MTYLYALIRKNVHPALGESVVNCLMYEDDLVLLSETKEGLPQSAFYVNLYRAVIGPSG